MIRIVFDFIGLFISALTFAQQDLRFVHLQVKPDFTTRSIQVIANETWSVNKGDSILKVLISKHLVLLVNSSIESKKINE